MNGNSEPDLLQRALLQRDKLMAVNRLGPVQHFVVRVSPNSQGDAHPNSTPSLTNSTTPSDLHGPSQAGLPVDTVLRAIHLAALDRSSQPWIWRSPDTRQRPFEIPPEPWEILREQTPTLSAIRQTGQNPDHPAGLTGTAFNPMPELFAIPQFGFCRCRIELDCPKSYNFPPGAADGVPQRTTIAAPRDLPEIRVTIHGTSGLCTCMFRILMVAMGPDRGNGTRELVDVEDSDLIPWNTKAWGNSQVISSDLFPKNTHTAMSGGLLLVHAELHCSGFLNSCSDRASCEISLSDWPILDSGEELPPPVR